MIKPNLSILLIAFILSCNSKKVTDQKAADVVNNCISTYGGGHYNNMDVSFDFRQFRVHIKQNDGRFLYEKTFKDSTKNEVHDMMTNDGFSREINGKKQELTEKETNKYREGINAVAYFVLLPYKLSEPAVNLKYLGETRIENKKYDKIAVSFNAEGGGKDHLDEFCYWIGQQDHMMDYLSYANGGPRFRKAVKRDTVDNIIFQNYENYQVLDSTLSTDSYDSAFVNGQVKLFSMIEQANYKSNK